MEILSATLPTVTPGTNATQGPHKVPHRYLHNPAVLNEIHFNPKQYAPKTISIVAPGAPGPRAGAGGRADGPSGLEDCLYYR